jgi:hypothetical protein
VVSTQSTTRYQGKIFFFFFFCTSKVTSKFQLKNVADITAHTTHVKLTNAYRQEREREEERERGERLTN